MGRSEYEMLNNLKQLIKDKEHHKNETSQMIHIFKNRTLRRYNSYISEVNQFVDNKTNKIPNKCCFEYYTRRSFSNIFKNIFNPPNVPDDITSTYISISASLLGNKSGISKWMYPKLKPYISEVNKPINYNSDIFLLLREKGDLLVLSVDNFPISNSIFKGSAKNIRVLLQNLFYIKRGTKNILVLPIKIDRVFSLGLKQYELRDKELIYIINEEFSNLRTLYKNLFSKVEIIRRRQSKLRSIINVEGGELDILTREKKSIIEEKRKLLKLVNDYDTSKLTTEKEINKIRLFLPGINIDIDDYSEILKEFNSNSVEYNSTKKLLQKKIELKKWYEDKLNELNEKIKLFNNLKRESNERIKKNEFKLNELNEKIKYLDKKNEDEIEKSDFKFFL